jgi:hypothetical protein
MPWKKERPLRPSVAHEWTRKFTEQFPLGAIGSDGARIQERLSEGDSRVMLWGSGREQTVQAVKHFLNGGGLDKYLSLVWQRT